MEKVGIEALRMTSGSGMATLQSTECLRKQRKRKDRARGTFYKDPYKFAEGLFVNEKTGTLKVPVGELEEHLKSIYSYKQRHVPATILTDMQQKQPPVYQMDTTTPTWSEVESTVKRARSASAHGSNNISYRVYKNTPGLLKYL